MEDNDKFEGYPPSKDYEHNNILFDKIKKNKITFEDVYSFLYSNDYSFLEDLDSVILLENLLPSVKSLQTQFLKNPKETILIGEGILFRLKEFEQWDKTFCEEVLQIDVADNFLEYFKSIAKWNAYSFSQFNPNSKNAIEFNTLDFRIRTQQIEAIQDNRKSAKAPANLDKIKALKEFCPGLMKKLQGVEVETQKEIIHLITGVNKVDSYKYSFGPRNKETNNREINNLEDLLNKINIK